MMPAETELDTQPELSCRHFRSMLCCAQPPGREDAHGAGDRLHLMLSGWRAQNILA